MPATAITTLDIYILNFAKTFLLIIPYILLFSFFRLRRDPFFLRTRAETQYNIAIGLVGISFSLLMLWQVSEILQDQSFLTFSMNNEPISHTIKNYKDQEILYILASSASDTVLLLLGTLAAILGWLFSTRSQVLSNRRNHSMQLLIESRLSERYMCSVNSVSSISIEFKRLNPTYQALAREYFECLSVQNKNDIYYMLNYCEFIAVGIRFGDLDEDLMLNTFGSMLKTNYEFFEEMIKEKQKTKLTHFEHMTALYRRWHTKNEKTPH